MWLKRAQLSAKCDKRDFVIIWLATISIICLNFEQEFQSRSSSPWGAYWRRLKTPRKLDGVAWQAQEATTYIVSVLICVLYFEKARFQLSIVCSHSRSKSSGADTRKCHTFLDVEKLLVIHLVSYCFNDAFEYRQYSLVDTSTNEKRSVSKYTFKMVKCMIARMISHTTNPFYPILTNGFLTNFKLVYITNCEHKSVSMWLFHFFMTKTSPALLYARFIAERTE